MSKDKTITEEQAVELIRAMVDREGSQSKVAAELRVSPSFISDILAGSRKVSDNIAKRLGYSKVIVYVKNDWEVN